ncbi:hypothetical protein JOM56_012906 [Amanita muscaria]
MPNCPSCARSFRNGTNLRKHLLQTTRPECKALISIITNNSEDEEMDPISDEYDAGSKTDALAGGVFVSANMTAILIFKSIHLVETDDDENYNDDMNVDCPDYLDMAGDDREPEPNFTPQNDADVLNPGYGDSSQLDDRYSDESEEDDEGGFVGNTQDAPSDDEIAPLTSISAHAPAADSDVTADLTDLDSDLQVESSSSAASLSISRTGPRSTPAIDPDFHIEPFPGSYAGKPIQARGSEPTYVNYIDQLKASESESEAENTWAPFNPKLDWEIARWAKLRGPGSTAVSDLLSIDGLQEALNLSYKNSRELNQIIDDQLPGRPSFIREQVKMAGETYDVYYRDIIKCIEALFSDPEFADLLLLKPEKHFNEKNGDNRYYHEMNTGLWWWKTQVELEKRKRGATIIPVIISSDKTQVTLFRSKQAYPVYLTIGNIPKHVRRKPSSRAHILLAYLPTTKLEQITNVESRRRAIVNLYHACMNRILSPLQTAGVNGVNMSTGHGDIHRNHPILAAHASDYPEQLLVAGVKFLGCPKCKASGKDLGDTSAELEFRDLARILQGLETVGTDPAGFAQVCEEEHIKPIIHPFWEKLPYVDIYRSITPDLLHQLYQGVIKHVFEWVISIYGATEIDARCQRFPPNHNIHIFPRGISSLSRVTGQEHNQMCRFLLGLLLGTPSSLSNTRRTAGRVTRAIRAILDFTYIASYPRQSTHTLQHLTESLDQLHQNLPVFIELGIRDNMNLPKLHALRHYVRMIELFGTTDNFNTEFTERLHIDLAKDAYRATNRKDEFIQMTIWLERKEKILRHENFLKWRTSTSQRGRNQVWKTSLPPINPSRNLQMAKHPSVTSVSLRTLETKYLARFFRAALARYVVLLSEPGIRTAAHLEERAGQLRFAFDHVSVYHKIRFLDSNSNTTLDAIHARPPSNNPDREMPVIFTAGELARAQVRVIFSISERSYAKLFYNGARPSKYLAYIEWFTPFSPSSVQPDTMLYKLSRAKRDDEEVVSIVPINSIRQSVHLFPHFGAAVSREWSSDTVLDKSSTFYLNPFSDRFLHSFCTGLET